MTASVTEKVRRRFIYPRYGNSLSLPINLRYSKYIEKCRQRFVRENQPTDADMAMVEKVRTNGFAQIVDAITPERARAMSEKITDIASGQTSSKKKARTAHLRYAVGQPIKELGPGILDLFRGPADPVLLAYFDSWYRLINVACYRTIPSSNPQGAWLWHTDNYPPAVKKIMLYLTDCEPKLGATSFISPAETARLRGGGYYGIMPDERSEDLTAFASRAAIKPTIQTPTVTAGSALLFDNNALHRANIPEIGYRDVVTFTVMPSAEPWETVLNREGLESLNNAKAMYPDRPRD
jgi:hypothetical protein